MNQQVSSFLRQLATHSSIQREWGAMSEQEKASAFLEPIADIPDSMEMPGFTIIGKRPYHSSTIWLLIFENGTSTVVEGAPTAGLCRTGKICEWHSLKPPVMPKGVVQAYKIQKGIIASKTRQSYGLRVQPYVLSLRKRNKDRYSSKHILAFLKGKK